MITPEEAILQVQRSGEAPASLVPGLDMEKLRSGDASLRGMVNIKDKNGNIKFSGPFNLVPK